MTNDKLRKILTVYCDNRRLEEQYLKEDEQLARSYYNQAKGIEEVITILEDYGQTFFMYTSEYRNGDFIKCVKVYAGGLEAENLQYIFYPCLQIFSWELEQI